jgi:nitroreductase
MNLLDAIYLRRAVRDYTDEAVAKTTIQSLLRAAVQAPSSLNQQAWAFAVIQGKDRLKGYSDRLKTHCFAEMLAPFDCGGRGDALEDPEFNIFYNAGTVIVICAYADRPNAAEDCSLAAQTLMLAAHEMGLSTCPIGTARAWLNLSEVKNELEIPPDLTAIFPLTLGYPAAQPNPTPRNAPNIVSWKSA